MIRITKILFFVAVILLTGCQQESTEDGSIAALLRVNDKEYYLQGKVNKSDIILGEKIGEVLEKTDKTVLPKNNFSSNYLNVGVPIYYFGDNSNLLLVEKEDGTYEQFGEGTN
jgi:hypothetical protein